jgi:hypothetical protein
MTVSVSTCCCGSLLHAGAALLNYYSKLMHSTQYTHCEEHSTALAACTTVPKFQMQLLYRRCELKVSSWYRAVVKCNKVLRAIGLYDCYFIMACAMHRGQVAPQ